MWRAWFRTTAVANVILMIACAGRPRSVAGVAEVYPNEDLDFGTSTPRWYAALPQDGTGAARIDMSRSDGAVATIDAGAHADARLIREIDAVPLRGRRVVFEVDARARAAGKANAFVRTSVARPSMRPSAWDSSKEAIAIGDAPTRLAAALDVPLDASSVSIEIGSSDGVAEFAGPSLATAPSPGLDVRGLSAEEHDRLAALANLIAYLRFFHPSDQAASIDWPSYEVEATTRMLQAKDEAQARDVLVWLTHAAAPTAVIYSGDRVPDDLDQPSSAEHLIRWHRYGLGGGPFYADFRDGQEPDAVGVGIYKTANAKALGSCKHAVARAGFQIKDGAPNVVLSLAPMRGLDAPRMATSTVSDQGHVEADLEPGVAAIVFGVRVAGHGSLDLDRVTLACDGHVIDDIAAGKELPRVGLGAELYQVDWDATCEGRHCVRVARSWDTTFSHQRDVLDVSVGIGARLHMPLAVWSDGAHTLPATKPPSLSRRWTAADLPARLATTLDTWLTLRWFYPYFDDLGMRWDDTLGPALDESARAASGEEQREAIAHLVAQLRDDHASARNPEFDDGIIPLFMRKVGTALYLLTALPSYADVLPAGSRVEAVDGVPIEKVLGRVSSTVSASTDGWKDYEVTFALGYGPRGRSMSILARDPSGAEHTVAVPRVGRGDIDKLREKHPDSGTELAPGVLYVDLDHVTMSAWNDLLPKLVGAKAIIFDLRGYLNDVAFEVLGHLAIDEIKSPFWDTPIIESSGPRRYERSQWTLFPEAPSLSARAIFLADGRTASAPETILQCVRHYHLGRIVGEQTGGTNGNVATFDTLGGLRVRFTGMRVLNQDGSLLHGQGITPDIVVHPTVEGVVAGRDEVLEAAIKAATTP